MAIDIYSVKAGCVAIQNAAQEYDNIISLVNQAKEESQAETIKINGATMATPFEEIIEQEIRDYIKRESNSGAVPDYVYDLSKTLKIEPQTILEYYNTQTGEKVVI